MRRVWCICAILICSGCTHPHWRLDSSGPAPLLVPPDVKNGSLTQRTIRQRVAQAKGACPPVHGEIPIEIHGGSARITVAATALSGKPAGTLAVWASELEASNCLAPGESLRLAARVAETLPLDPAAAFRLLNPDESRTGEIDIPANSRLLVMSPYWKQPGAGMIEGPVNVTGESNAHLTVTGKYTENLLGEETSLYALRPKAHGRGSAIMPLYATVRLADGSSLQRHDQPAVNYFQFPSNAAFYRLFLKATATDFNGLLVAAPTPAELDRRTKILESSQTPASCDLLPAQSCIAIPKDVAVSPVVSVWINGSEVLVPRGARLSGALLLSGQKQPATLVSTLDVRKPWKGRMVPVTFDRGSGAILELTLLGGETVTYTQK